MVVRTHGVVYLWKPLVSCYAKSGVDWVDLHEDGHAVLCGCQAKDAARGGPASKVALVLSLGLAEPQDQ